MPSSGTLQAEPQRQRAPEVKSFENEVFVASVPSGTLIVAGSTTKAANSVRQLNLYYSSKAICRGGTQYNQAAGLKFQLFRIVPTHLQGKDCKLVSKFSVVVSTPWGL